MTDRKFTTQPADESNDEQDDEDDVARTNEASDDVVEAVDAALEGEQE